MTRKQLDAIRARARSIEANKPPNAVWLFVRQDVPALLAEVEGMHESCTGLVKQNERQYDEVLRLTAERDAAFTRGVAAMREAARMSFVAEAEKWQHEGDGEMELRYLRLAGEIRALPDPEDTP